jgi:hypothetical protein
METLPLHIISAHIIRTNIDYHKMRVVCKWLSTINLQVNIMMDLKHEGCGIKFAYSDYIKISYRPSDIQELICQNDIYDECSIMGYLNAHSIYYRLPDDKERYIVGWYSIGNRNKKYYVLYRLKEVEGTQ